MALAVSFLVALTAKPNIFMLLTDDQDLILGGLDQMPNVKKFLTDEGTYFTNGMVHTPICCPSRSSFLSGRYLHNSFTFQNDVKNGCANDTWAMGPERDTYAVHAQNAGYRTSYSGKYLNAYGNVGSYQCQTKSAAGCNRVPPGWTDWHGLVGNSRYYNASIIDNGVRTNYGDDTSTDYAPDLFFTRIYSFLEDHLKFHAESPFLAVLATPSCHGPFTPADKYIGRFSNSSAPRPPNFNHSNEDKQWVMRQLSPISNSGLQGIDSTHNSRWETLLSVDDYVERIISLLDSSGHLENTFFLYTSDHGFNLGNHRLPGDKRHPYDHDLRIPFVMRGPGVPKGIKSDAIVMNIDIAPTFAAIATGEVPPGMDGRDIRETWTPSLNSQWRTDFMVQYKGGYKLPCFLEICPPPPKDNFHCIDGINNTYTCIRQIDPSSTAAFSDALYCEFVDSEGFIEIYDHSDDPYQLKNLWKSAPASVLSSFKARLEVFRECKGADCRRI